MGNTDSQNKLNKSPLTLNVAEAPEMKSFAHAGECQSRASSLGLANFEAREGLLKDENLNVAMSFWQQERSPRGQAIGLQCHLSP